MTGPDTALDHARNQWHQTNTRIGDASGHGNPPDPHLYAALLDSRAGWWDHIGHLADRKAGEPETRDVYAIACSYAAILDRTDAARIRFRYRIPTLHPSSVAELIGLNDNRCGACGRPWLLDPAGACPDCPALLHGITPGNAAEAATYPPGRPWTPEHTLGQEDVSTARHQRGRDEPLTETEWNALRELAWSPAFEPPAGIPERYRHDALRLALGEAERLAGRARSNRSTTAELAEILAKHRVMVAVDGRGQTPKLYTDLLEWDALNTERETYRLREQDLNPLPDKIPARVKSDATDVEDGPVFLRQRPIPAQLDYFAEKLATHLDETITHDAFAAIGGAVVNLSRIANELRNTPAGGQ